MPSFALSGSPNWKEQPTNFVAPANAPASTIVWSRRECTYQLPTSTTMTLRMRMRPEGGGRRAPSARRAGPLHALAQQVTVPKTGAAISQIRRTVPFPLSFPARIVVPPAPFSCPSTRGNRRRRPQAALRSRCRRRCGSRWGGSVAARRRYGCLKPTALAARARIEYAEASVRDRSPPWQLEWEAFSRSWLFRKTLPASFIAPVGCPTRASRRRRSNEPLADRVGKTRPALTCVSGWT